MAKVLCKTSDNIYWMRFLKPGQTVFSCSNFDLSNKNVIDIGWLNVKFYDGWSTNEHHITTKSYYKMILPFMSLYMDNFKFNIDDFDLVKYYTDDGFDVSYLVLKNTDLKFTIDRNGVLLSEHGDFSSLINMEKLWEEPPCKDCKTAYHYLFRGTHSCCKIINETIDTDKTILVTGNSMSVPIIPILCCYYKEVVYLDNRDGLSHSNYFEGKVFDDVIIQLWEGDLLLKPLSINLK